MHKKYIYCPVKKKKKYFEILFRKLFFWSLQLRVNQV